MSRSPDASDIAWLTARPIAHRGLHQAATGRTENTLPAFAAAIGRGFAIECDVRLAGDDEAVVFHDETLDRLTQASGSLARRDVGELHAIRFKAAADVRIPTLEELLDLVDGRVPVFVELKAEGGESERLAAVVAATLAPYDGPVATMSFNPAALGVLRRAAPQLLRGMVVDAFAEVDHPGMSPATRFARRNLLAAPLVLPQFIACDRRHLSAAMPRLFRHFVRLPILAWTVRSPIERRSVAGLADQIIFEGFDPDARAV